MFSQMLLLMATLSASVFATPLPVQASPACRMWDLDITLDIGDGPVYSYTLAVNFRNVSPHPCTLNRFADEPSFFFQDEVPASLFTRCVSSHECATSRASVEGPGVTLEPGTVGHQEYSWKTRPGVADGPCITPWGMDNTVNQDRPHFRAMSSALFRRICSPIIAGAYMPGSFRPDHRPDGGDTQPLPLIHFVATAEKYYDGERIPFRAAIEDPGQTLSRQPNSCPVVLVRVRQPLGWITFDELRQRPCKIEPGKGITVNGELAGGHLAVGAHDLALLAVALSPAHQLKLVQSPEFRMQIDDPATIERKWSPQARGIAVSLMLDRNNYELGQDVPLHIAMENFAAEGSITGLLDAPMSQLEVELRDSCGQEIEPRGGMTWTSHGMCGEYPRGKMIPAELSLRDFGLQPEAVGSYNVVVTWHPAANGCLITTGPDTTVQSAPALVHSGPVTFEVVDPDHPDTIKNMKCAKDHSVADH